ncbi:anti-sigma factor family protein [Cohnella sp. GCM10012308]|uniref:anti-sigma factor family protein n=1 Tax=Cohnella sp. GCM10012308 TaxID=3317329 RepID=UPI00360F4838
MNREEGMELVQRSIDGDLNEEESSRLQLYLQNYPECAALLERLTRLSEELTQLPHVTPRYSLVDAILPQLERIVPEPAPDAVRAPAAAAAPELRSRRTGNRKSMYRSLAAVVAAGVVAGVLLIAHPFSLLPDSDQQKSALQQESAAQAAPGDASSDIMRKNMMNDETAPDAADKIAGASASSEQSQSSISSDGSADGASPSVGGTSLNASGGGASGGSSTGESGTSAGATGIVPTAKIETQKPSADPNAATGSAGGSRLEFAPPAAASSGTSDKTDQDTRNFAGAQGDSPAKSGTGASGPAASEAPSIANVPEMSLSAAMPSWASPDGKLTALAYQGGLRIVKTDGLETVFESGNRDGAVSDVSWGQDGQDLYYTWTDASGKATELWWNAKENREQTR